MIGKIAITITTIILLVLAIPIAIILSLFTSAGMQILISVDQLFGTFIYGTEDITISSYTYKRCHFDHKFCWFRRLIDIIFSALGQKNHCEKSYNNEMRELKDIIDRSLNRDIDVK